MPELATLIAIAEAIVDRINGANSTLSLGFTAERAYVPIHGLRELVDPVVTVVPAELSMTLLSRGLDDFDYVMSVAVQKKVDGITRDDIDPLMRFMEEIMDLFRSQPLGYTDSDDAAHRATCVAAENAPVFDPGMLDEKRVFTSLLTLTFREARTR